jgi:hypothetical protein
LNPVLPKERKRESEKEKESSCALGIEA